MYTSFPSIIHVLFTDLGSSTDCGQTPYSEACYWRSSDTIDDSTKGPKIVTNKRETVQHCSCKLCILRVQYNTLSKSKKKGAILLFKTKFFISCNILGWDNPMMIARSWGYLRSQDFSASTRKLPSCSVMISQSRNSWFLRLFLSRPLNVGGWNFSEDIVTLEKIRSPTDS